MRAFAIGESGRTPLTLEEGVAAELRTTSEAIAERSLLLWDEHCSECAMPACFATCSLYTPRQDFKCRRFEQGIENLVASQAAAAASPLMSVAFRQWGKLEAKSDGALVPMARAGVIESTGFLAGRAADARLFPARTRRKAGKALDLMKSAATRMASRGTAPDLFVLEVINPGEFPVALTLMVKPETPGLGGFFQAGADIAPGYNRVCLPAGDILARVGAARPLLFQIEPLAVTGRDRSLIFGLADFVKLRPGARLESTSPGPAGSAPAIFPDSQAPKVKCVVWDLDNTLWSGILIEDGPESVQLNPKVAALVVELDRRGILNSIASKNSAGEAEIVLRRFGLWDYFLFPQIHWNPKSASIATIAAALNIGLDSLVLIDDQAFERAEVGEAFPAVETLDVDVFDQLIDRPRFRVPVSAESQRRRSMYQVEQIRQEAFAGATGDYAAFLAGCAIRLTIDDLDDRFLNRAFELTERTNQLNYSGVRLSRPDLEGLMKSPQHRLLVLSVTDRFGDYGVVGIALLDAESWTVECFFMSCRVQRKKVEHAFFAHLLRLGRARGKARLTVRYKATAKNEPSRVVLEDEMMFCPGTPDGTSSLFQLATTETIVDSDLVSLDDRSALWHGVTSASAAIHL